MASLSKDDYLKIYALWDNSSPVDGDCGQLCSSACCKEISDCPAELVNQDFFAEYEGDSDEMGMYLLPGEEEVCAQETSCFSITKDNPAEYNFPPSWTEPVYFVKCSGPAKCSRELRPIQCRTFPLQPHLCDDGRLKLIYYSDPLPYKCPLVSKETKLNQSFLLATFIAWQKLLQDQRIFDLVKEDSDYRDSSGAVYKVAYPFA